MTDPLELLRDYAEHGSDDAFRDLVQHYVHLVHATALRRANGSSDMAEEITQTVFIDLARQTREGRGPLTDPQPFLGGWLHRHTCFVAANLGRARQRRLAREQAATAMNTPGQEPDAVWDELAPAVDEALDELETPDRQALLLRFHEALDLRTLGNRLGITDDAAQKRVARALDRLKDRLLQRGIALPVLVLGSLLLDRATTAAPAGLGTSVAAAAVESAHNLHPQTHAATAGRPEAGLAALVGAPPLLVGLAVILALVLGLAALRPGLPSPEAPNATAALAALSQTQTNPRTDTTPRPNRTGPGEGPGTPASPAAAAASTVTEEAKLKLSTVALDSGKPVPRVALTVRTWVGNSATRQTLATDAAGIASIPYPPRCTRLEVFTALDAYADCHLDWQSNRGHSIPDAYRLRLRPAVRIGGMVTDTDGTPIFGATILLNENRPSSAQTEVERVGIHAITTETDVTGRWQIHRVAETTLPDLILSVRHPDYTSGPATALDGNPARLTALRAGSDVVRLASGGELFGRVETTDGKPVPDALVFTGARHDQQTPRARTGPNGTFTLQRCPPGTNLVTAEATGLATRTIFAAPTSPPSTLRIRLDPGRPLRLRLLDAAGASIEGVRISYNPREFDLRNRFRIARPQAEFEAVSDAEGRAVWEHAPAGGLTFDLLKPGFAPATARDLSADTTEHEVVLRRALSVTGTVIDAVSGLTIPRFDVFIAAAWTNTPPEVSRPEFRDHPGFRRSFENGTFRWMCDEPLFGGYQRPDGYHFKVEAEGYAPEVSRLLGSGDGDVTLRVELSPAETVLLTVRAPDGTPAADAQVVQVESDSSLVLGPGGIGLHLAASLLHTDAEGRVRLPAQATPIATAVSSPAPQGPRPPAPPQGATVLAVHPTGMATATRQGLGAGSDIRLHPWARIEGVFRQAGNPVAGRKLTLSEGPSSTRLVLERFETETDTDGRFSFPRVPPLPVRLGAPGEVATGVPGPLVNESFEMGLDPKPGETLHVDLGRDGRPISLRIRLPDGDVSPIRFVLLTSPTPKPPPGTEADPAAAAAWMQRPEVRSALAALSQWTLRPGTNSSWSAASVPPGEYELHVFVEGAGGEGRPSFTPRTAPVAIPAGDAREAVDLGELLVVPPPR